MTKKKILSKEVEKRFDEKYVLPYLENKKDYPTMREDMLLIEIDEIKQFLSDELERQKEKIIEKLWEYHGQPFETESILHMIKTIKEL